MNPPDPRTSRHAWLPALLLSLLLHGGLALPYLLVASPGPLTQGPGPWIDTRIRTRKMEVGIVFCESAPPRRTGAGTAVRDQSPVAPIAPLTKHVVKESELPPRPDSPVATLGPGENEEQEEPTGTGPVRGSEGSGTGTGAGTTSFFQIPTESQTVVYVIDRSASMGPQGFLDAAKRELLASLRRLPSSARFQIIAYNSSAEPLPLQGGDGLVLASPDNKRLAASLMDKLFAEGATAHVPALRRALALHAEVIYFLTDADDLKEEQVRALTRFNHGQSAIHAIELVGPHRAGENRPLQLLAQENHGIYKSVIHSP